MSGVTGIGTTFSLPNYQGELFALTPADTPLLSSIGGLTGGMQSTATTFEWQNYDLRDPANRQRLEGAVAPTAENRVRGTARNTVEIHQESVSVSYTKRAAVQQFTTPSAAPFQTNGSQVAETPVIDELNWQLQQSIKSIARDVNWTFWNGKYNLPTDNSTARQTRGLLEAITTNKVTAASAVTSANTLTSATDTITETGTGLADGDAIVFVSTGAASNIVAGRKYFVVSKSTNTFKVAATSGGSALTLGTATGIQYVKPRTSSLTVADIDDLARLAYDNGGLSESFTATIAVNSTQRVAITNAFADAYGKADAMAGTRNVGGLAVDTVKTNFGTMNLMLDRHLPQDALVILSLEQLAPVFLAHPEKGVFFAEPLAKTGAFDSYQLYGEIGLKYGNELAHAQLRGLKV